MKVGQGGTIRLDAQYQALTGELVVPTTPRLDVIDSANIEVLTDQIPVNDAVGLYHFDYVVSGAAPLGMWRAHWTGVINGVPVSGDDLFEVVAAGEIVFPDSPVVSKERYRIITLDTTSADAAVTGALVDAQQLVEDYLDRKLTQALRTETMTYGPNGLVWPKAWPVIVAPAGMTIERSRRAIGGSSPGGLTDAFADSDEPEFVTLTYTGGYTSATLPRVIESRIAWSAYSMLHPSVGASVPAGAKSVSVGDASITFDKASSGSAVEISFIDLKPYRRRHV